MKGLIKQHQISKINRTNCRSYTPNTNRLKKDQDTFEKSEDYIRLMRQNKGNYLSLKSMWNYNFHVDQLAKISSDYEKQIEEKNSIILELIAQKNQYLATVGTSNRSGLDNLFSNIQFKTNFLSQKKYSGKNNQSLVNLERQNQIKSMELSYKMNISRLLERINQLEVQLVQTNQSKVNKKFERITQLQKEIIKKNSELSLMEIHNIENQTQINIQLKQIEEKNQQIQKLLKTQKIIREEQRQKHKQALNKCKKSYQNQVRIMNAKFAKVKEDALFQSNERIKKYQDEQQIKRREIELYCRNLEIEKNSFLEKITFYQKQKQNLQYQIKEYEKQLKTKEISKIKIIQQQYSQRLRIQSKQAKKTIQQLKKQIQILNQQGSFMKKSAILSEQKSIKNYERQLSASKARFDQLSQNYEIKNTEISLAFNEKTKQLENLRQQYKNYIFQLQNENKALKQQNILLEKKYQEAKIIVNSRVKDRDNFIVQLEQKLHLSQKNDKLLQKLLKQQQQKYNAINLQLQRQKNQQIEQQRKQISEIQNKMHQNMLRNQIQKQEIAILKGKIQNYQQRLQNKTENYKKELIQFKSNNCQRISENLKKDYEERFLSQQSEINELLRKIQKIEKENQLLLFEHQGVKNKYYILSLQKQEIIENKERQIKFKNEEIQQYKQSNVEMAKTLQMKYLMIDQQRKSITTSYETVVQRHKTQIISLNQKIYSISKQNEKYIRQLKNIQQKIKSMEQTLIRERQQRQKSQIFIKEIQSQLEMKKEIIQQHQETYKIEIERQSQKEKIFFIEKEQISRQIQELSKLFNIKQAQYNRKENQLEEQLANQKKKNNKVLNQKKDIHIQLTKIYEQTKMKLQDYQTKNIELQYALESKNKEINNLNYKIQMKDLQINDQHETMIRKLSEEHQQKIQTYIFQIKKLNEKVNKVEEQKLKLERSFKIQFIGIKTEKKNTIEGLLRKCQELKQIILMKQKQYLQLISQNERLKMKCTSMNKIYYEIMQSLKHNNQQNNLNQQNQPHTGVDYMIQSGKMSEYSVLNVPDFSPSHKYFTLNKQIQVKVFQKNCQMVEYQLVYIEQKQLQEQEINQNKVQCIEKHVNNEESNK